MRRHFLVMMVVTLLFSSALLPSDSGIAGPGASVAASQPLPPLADKSGAFAGSSVMIHLASHSFDPLQALPSLPDRLTYAPAEIVVASTYILQFTGPVMPEWKQAVVAAGGQLGDYIPDYAFLAHLATAAKARVEALPFVRWVGPYQPAYKLASDVAYDDARSYRIILAPWASPTNVRTAVATLDPQSRSFDQGISAVLTGAELDQVARMPDVIWIEPYHLQRSYNKGVYNDIGGGTIMGGTAAWSNGYTGNGVTVAVADTGLDTGNPASIHQDFSGRVTHISSWPVVYANYGGGCAISNAGANDGAADLASGHGSHVTGSVAGNGAHSGGQFKGLAYQASITFQAVEQYTTWQIPNPGCPNGYYLAGIPDDVRTLLNEVYGWGARVQNDSWGGGTHGAYDQQDNYFDDFIHTHPDMAVIVAAGNDGTDADNDGYVDENSISSPGTAKNVITVGASENERTTGGYTAYTWGQAWPGDFGANPTGGDRISNNRGQLAAFSSRGPMNDGRIKPDVVAPGTDIISVRSSQATGTGWGIYNSYYMYDGGTSMASPLTAGAAALVRDYYMDHEGVASPSAALIKATLINSAVDIPGYGNTSREAGQPIPNNHEGWGRVDVGAATTPGNRQFVDNTTGINTGTTATYSYTVNTGHPFKVSLVWSDHPGTPLASPTLVNNLNVLVTAPNGATTYWGNRFSGGWSQTGGSADTVNNVENVYIQSPTAGTWKVQVIGQNVPQGPQPFALVVDGNIVTGADVSIHKDVVDESPQPGDPITFTLSIANTGGVTATNVVVTDVLPSQVLTPSYNSTLLITPTGVVSYVWNVGTLGVGESGVITIYGQIDPGLPGSFSFTNNASISALEDVTPDNNTSSVTVGENRVLLPVVLKDWGTVTGWTTIASQDFEGNFPGAWVVFDNDASTNGVYFWAKRNCRAFAGGNSGWAVGGGANGSGLSCGVNYPNSTNSWMVYGPFSLAGATAADLSFKLWLNSEINFDRVCRLASTNGLNFSGTCTTGNTSGWVDRVLDLTSVGSLGNLTGQSNVWVALVFSSDINNNYPEGGYVDNIALRKYVSATGLAPQSSSLNMANPGIIEFPVTLVRPH